MTDDGPICAYCKRGTDEQLVELWSAGATLSEICVELACTRGSPAAPCGAAVSCLCRAARKPAGGKVAPRGCREPRVVQGPPEGSQGALTAAAEPARPRLLVTAMTDARRQLNTLKRRRRWPTAL